MQPILELLSNDCIIEHPIPPLCVNPLILCLACVAGRRRGRKGLCHAGYPLSVAEGKKPRLVLDRRHVNKYLVRPKFKYEGLRSLSLVLDEGYSLLT